MATRTSFIRSPTSPSGAVMCIPLPRAGPNLAVAAEPGVGDLRLLPCGAGHCQDPLDDLTSRPASRNARHRVMDRSEVVRNAECRYGEGMAIVIYEVDRPVDRALG